MSNYIIKIPPKCTPEEADRWRVVAEALRQLSDTSNKVNSKTDGLSAIQGKVKINQYDSTANYLEDKLIAGNDISFVQSNDGTGSKKITANLSVYTSNTAPTNPTDGMIWLDLDEPFGTPFTIGDGAAGVDYELKFDGETNDGSIYWMEGENYFKIVDTLLVDSTKSINFYDTAVGINSANDGYLDLYADTGIRVTKTPRATTSLYCRYYHIALGAANPGASGATWVVASANTTGGWRLTNAAWLLRGQADIHADWDGATDMNVGVSFMVNIDNTGGLDTDTVDLKLVAYYKGVGDTVCKSQTVEVATVVGKSAQYKQFKVTFTIDWNYASNVVEVGDIISIILNIETDTSEVDDIVITSMEFYYPTAHLGIESGDV
jgi:hypothetical protein